MRIPPIEESPSDTPNYDRLRQDPSPVARVALSMIDAMPRGTPEARERIASRHYNRELGPDGMRQAAEHVEAMQYIATTSGDGSERMRQQLVGLASTLSELDDTEFSRKLRQQYTIFKKRYDDATGASARVRADNVFQVEDAMQQGRGELTPAAIARAVQNLADNPLVARKVATE